MNIRLLMTTVGTIAVLAGAASAQGRPGGAAPGQSNRPAGAEAPRNTEANLPRGAANADARGRSQNRGGRGEAGDENSSVAAALDTEPRGQDRRTNARSNRRGPARANARAIERSNANAGLRTSVGGDIGEQQARATTADLNRRSLEGSLEVSPDGGAVTGVRRQGPDRASPQGAASSSSDAGLRNDAGGTQQPRRPN